MAQRRPIIAGNWKMHRDHLEAIQLVQKLAYHLREEDYEDQEIVVCPPFVALRSVQTLLQSDKLPIGLGAQDCHPQDEGAFTGEISAPMLARLDVTYVLCGHSERRSLLGETDELVNAKVAAVQRNGMRPLVCVGESLEQREAGAAVDTVTGQLRASLAKVAIEDPASLVIAYEPVWAIGTGRRAGDDDAQQMCAAVREQLASQYDTATAEQVRVLYGGSVKPGNVRDLLAQPDVDGALVGGASLSSDDFALIVGHPR